MKGRMQIFLFFGSVPGEIFLNSDTNIFLIFPMNQDTVRKKLNLTGAPVRFPKSKQNFVSELNA